MKIASYFENLCQGNLSVTADFPSQIHSNEDVRFLLSYLLNSSPPGQDGRHFKDDIFRYISVNEKFCILIKISLKFVAKSPIDNNPA